MTNAHDEVPPASPADADTPRARGTWWRLPLLLAVVLVAIVFARASQTHQQKAALDAPAAPPSADATGKTVSLTIQFDGDRKREFDAIAWHPGMSVDDLMMVASRLPEGITYTASGDHEMKLLGSIDGIDNELGGGRNWTYRVNDFMADRSLAVYELQPGDRVLWIFGRRE